MLWAQYMNAENAASNEEIPQLYPVWKVSDLILQQNLEVHKISPSKTTADGEYLIPLS